MNILNETINKIMDGDDVQEALKTYIKNLEQTSLILEMTHSFKVESKLIDTFDPVKDMEFIIQVRGGGLDGREEDHIDEPHFHVLGIPKRWYKNNFVYNARVRLDKPIYNNEPPIALKLCPTILAAVIDTLKKESKCVPSITNNWETFVFYWNASNAIPRVKVDKITTEIPDYSKLPTITDEEWVLTVKSKLGIK